jgi:hypothetical protein
MNASPSSATTSDTVLQQILGQRRVQPTAVAGQNVPGADPSSAVSAGPDAPALPPPAKPNGSPGVMFGGQTLSALIAAQAQPPSAADVANDMVGAADADGSGGLSEAEVAKAVVGGSTSSADVASAFAKLDTDGDGQLTAAELTSALEAPASTASAASPSSSSAAQAATDPEGASGAHHGRRHHHHHGGGAPPETASSSTSTSTSTTATAAASPGAAAIAGATSTDDTTQQAA